MRRNLRHRNKSVKRTDLADRVGSASRIYSFLSDNSDKPELSSDEKRVVSGFLKISQVLLVELRSQKRSFEHEPSKQLLEARAIMDAFDLIDSLMFGREHPVHSYLKGIRSVTASRKSASAKEQLLSPTASL